MRPRTPLITIALGFCALAAAGHYAAGQEAVCVRAQAFDIEYRVRPDAQPLESAQLWYTLDGGLTWVDYGRDEDRLSPIRFRAPREGLFGFFVVLTNAAGPSSAPPATNTPPQQWALVDFTPPVVQFHEARLTTSLGEPMIQIRWTAVDAQFGPRPVELFYSSPPGAEWLRITSEPIANTGRYDWRVPPDLQGTTVIRIDVSDRGGHRTESEPQTVELAVAQPPLPVAPAVGSDAETVSDDAALAGSTRSKERAARLLAEAIALRDRGEFATAVTRLREAVKLDPQLTPAFAEMAGMLQRLGDLDRAMNAYDIALRQEPNSRDALRGMAAILQQKRDYASAAGRLRTILRYHPTDAEVWLQLGDVAVFQGDEVKARECYTRATQIDPKAAGVIAEARQRLVLMAEVSREPGPRKP